MFDGYTDVLSLKVIEQLRRCSNVKTAANVTVAPDMMVTAKRDEFLRNVKNKQQLIEYLCEKLKQNDI